MKRQKRAIARPVATPSVRPEDVFATFVAQAHALGQELDARRRFDEQVTEYLKQQNLVDAFEAWRAKSVAAPKA